MRTLIRLGLVAAVTIGIAAALVFVTSDPSVVTKPENTPTSSPFKERIARAFGGPVGSNGPALRR